MLRQRKKWIALGIVLLLAILFYERIAVNRTADPLYNRIASLVLRESNRAGARQILPRMAESVGIYKWDASPYDMDVSEMGTWRVGNADQSLLVEARTLFQPGSSIAHNYITRKPAHQLDTSLFALALKPWYEQNEEDALDAATNLVETDPDNAMNHYLRAFLLINLGEPEEAQRSIQSGNRAANCEFPLPYPADVLAAGKTPLSSVGDKQVAGTIWGHVCYSRLLTIKAKEAFKNMEVCIKLGFPLDSADDFVIMVKRIAQSKNIPVVEQWGMFTIARSFTRIIGEEIIDLSPSQQAEYDALMAELEKIPETMKSRLNPRGESFDYGYGQEPEWDFAYPALIRISFGLDQFHQVTRRDFREVGSKLRKELETTTEVSQLFNCLEPPPFAIWAAGKLRSDVVDSR
jgi:hypothetical protein